MKHSSKVRRKTTIAKKKINAELNKKREAELLAIENSVASEKARLSRFLKEIEKSASDGNTSASTVIHSNAALDYYTKRLEAEGYHVETRLYEKHYTADDNVWHDEYWILYAS